VASHGLDDGKPLALFDPVAGVHLHRREMRIERLHAEAVIEDEQGRRGTRVSTVTEGDDDLRSTTQGRATYTMQFDRYQEVPDGIAEDIVQMTFVRVWKHRERWTTAGKVSAYLYRVTRNLALNAVRDRKAGLEGSQAGCVTFDGAHLQPSSFGWQLEDKIATLTLTRPERKNPLTFESYAELRDTFRQLVYASDVRAVVITGAGENFCSGGDVHDIIGPLVAMKNAGRMDDLLAFTRMTGDLVKAMRACPQPIVAAIDGVCAGAGAILAMASDLRLGTARSKVAFLFVRVGLSGADMGACAILPRIIGQGRASELLYTGRSMSAAEGQAWGFFNEVADPVLPKAMEVAQSLASGPTAAHAMTKTMLHQEWNVGIDQAIDMEAQAQAMLMQNQDFRRAYEAFATKQKPVFQGD
jgi:enoyl-CoA hydratase/carnithine racemase